MRNEQDWDGLRLSSFLCLFIRGSDFKNNLFLFRSKVFQTLWLYMACFERWLLSFCFGMSSSWFLLTVNNWQHRAMAGTPIFVVKMQSHPFAWSIHDQGPSQQWNWQEQPEKGQPEEWQGMASGNLQRRHNFRNIGCLHALPNKSTAFLCCNHWTLDSSTNSSFRNGEPFGILHFHRLLNPIC